MSSRRSRPLPSLTALRAFEAAGHHGSFRRAAEALHVTESAISHQIRQLEAELKVALFVRERGATRLTPEGEALLPGLRAGFAELARAVAALDQRRGHLLNISMLSTFAMRWFIPRLARFQALNPDIEVRISTSVDPVDFSRSGIDCAIRFGAGTWPDLAADLLFSERLTPVCSPMLASAPRPLAEPRDLAHHTLLHARLRPDDWRIWLHAAGVADCDPDAGPVFETRNFAIAAAVQGLGIAVVEPALAADECATGRLIEPFPQRTPHGGGAYYLVCPRATADAPRIAALRRWLIEEVAAVT
jgi:LysR family transcriptional regulator, glycine cleavage system transcriptional activator